MMAEGDTYIRLDRVRKEFGAVVAVKDVSLDIGRAEFFSLLGPSGCGKTTLLRILSGLDFPSSGRVLVDGADISTLPPYRRPTNMVFQSYAVFPHLSVGENIAYGLRRQRLDRKERGRQVGDMLELIGLPGFADRWPHQLSGGQLQRIALARALILRPKVLLLDEPLAALDKKLRERMQVELRSIQREVGITFVFVTHDQEEALTLSDRVGVMANGVLLQCSPPKDLYDSPASKEVAEFVGEMNLLDGRVVQARGDSVEVDVEGFGVSLIPRGMLDIQPGQNVHLALRPEWLTLEKVGKGGPRGTILERSYFGNRSNLLVSVPGVRKPMTVTALEWDQAVTGHACGISLNLRRAVLLPKS